MFRSRILAIGFLPLMLGAQTADGVRVWEDTLTLPTYKEDKPSPAPPFDQFGINGYGNFLVYPYTMRLDLLNQKRDVEWRVLNIENRYLHCRVMPDWGGHVYGCKDKLSGANLLYENVSIKKTLTGTRGAWVAGGIETSFPVAHSRLSVSPVHFATSADADGSATIWVGAVDRVSGMEWRSAYTLRPDSAVLEQKVWLYNRGSVRQPYQYWNNAAVRQVDKGTGIRLTFPMWVTMPHGAGNMNSWPVNVAGVNMRDSRSYAHALGLFAYNSREPFMSAYNPESRIGFSHWADPKVMPGKKAWVWGVEDTYRGAFSDDQSGYIELVAALMATQDMFEFLEPQQSKSFTELWIPSRDTAGITRAAPDAVLFLERRKQQDGSANLGIEMSATRKIAGATLTVSNGDRTLYRQTLDLDPAASFRAETPVVEAGVKYRVELKDSAGKTLLAHIEDTWDAALASEVTLLAPPPKPPIPKRDAVAEAMAKTEQDERERMWDRALATYHAALASAPSNHALQKAAGRFAINLGRFEEAAALLGKAHVADAADIETAYYLGVAKAGLGDDGAARGLWQTVPAESPFASAARFEAACALARAGDPKAALLILHELAARRIDRAAPLEVALLRRLGEKDAARAALDRALRVNPMDLLLRVEAAALSGRDDAALSRHLAADPEWVLDVADDYFRVGLFEEAAAVLGRPYAAVPENETEPGAVLPQNHPIVVYHLGYAKLRAGQSPAADFQRASELSTLYIHPFRTTSALALQAALEANPHDLTAHYLVGCVLFSRRMTDEAIAEWNLVKPAAARFPGYYETMTRVLVVVKKDVKQANAEVKTAIAANPEDTALKETLIGVLPKDPAEAKDPAFSDAPVVRAFATSMEGAEYVFRELTDGHVSRALNAFTGTNFPREKELPDVRQAYIETKLRDLLENSRIGRCELVIPAIEDLGTQDKTLPLTFGSFGPILKQLRIQFYLGLAEFVCGRRKEAAGRLLKVSKASAPVTSADFAFPVVASVLFAELDPAKTVQAALDKLHNTKEDVDSSILLYSEGMLLRAIGKREEAAKKFAEGSRTGSMFARYLNGAAQFDPPIPR